MKWRHLLTWAGALTFSRLLMAGTLPCAIGSRWLLPLYLVAIWTDVADGYVARRWGHVTRAGAAFDAWVDKSLHVNLGWAIALSDAVPDWYMLCWFSRELIQLPMHFVLMHRFRTEAAPPPQTSAWGRATAVTLALAFIAVLGGWPGSALVRWLTVLTGVLGTIASLDYARVFLVGKLAIRESRRRSASSPLPPDPLPVASVAPARGTEAAVVEPRAPT